MLTDEELQEISRWLHRVDHLRWRKGLWVLPEGEMVAECWMPDTAPEWALELAAAGEPGSRWCPQITPSLPGS
jgi:hypothetical protein